MTEGYLYCFSNQSMPGILKVSMTEKTPEITLNEANSSSYKIEFAKKVLNPKQKEQLLKNRRYINLAPDMSKEKLHWGLFVPDYIDKKEKKNKHNLFKILTAGVAYGKKTGIVCTSLHKPQHIKMLSDLGIPNNKLTKEKYCITIANELYKINTCIQFNKKIYIFFINKFFAF